MTVDSRVEEILARLAQVRANLKVVLAPVPEAVRQRRPEANRWSIPGVLEHLARTERRVHQVLHEAVNASNEHAAASSDAASYCVSYELLVDRSRRLETRDTLAAQEARNSDVVWEELQCVRNEFITFVTSTDANRLARVERPHPVLGLINGLQWVDFVGAHEARHTAQIVENLEFLAAHEPWNHGVT
ncbi:MAG: DinB family protein [Longimicrobiales bacterium]